MSAMASYKVFVKVMMSVGSFPLDKGFSFTKAK